MDEIDYGELFGIEMTGENEQEPAEPVEAEQDREGENDQEPAEPDEENGGAEDNGTAGDTAETEDEPDNDAAPENYDKPEVKQDAATNAAYAAARRKAEAERDAAIAEAKKQAQEEADRYIDEAFKKSGLTNPYTKQPITSKAEYDEYMQKFEEEKRNRILKKAGVSEEELRDIINSSPEVKEARTKSEQAEAELQKFRSERAKIDIDKCVKEISELDPTIKSISDIAALPNYPDIYGRVQRGMTLTEAFKLANFDALSNKAAAASRQAAMNAAASKAHMTGTTSRGSGAVSVPADVMAEYRAFMPDASAAEIQKHYNKYLKH